MKKHLDLGRRVPLEERTAQVSSEFSGAMLLIPQVERGAGPEILLNGFPTILKMHGAN